MTHHKSIFEKGRIEEAKKQHAYFKNMEKINDVAVGIHADALRAGLDVPEDANALDARSKKAAGLLRQLKTIQSELKLII